MKLGKYYFLLGIIVWGVFSSLLAESAASQSFDDCIPYQSILNLNSYPKNIQTLILDLENNWSCIDKRNLFLDKLKGIKNQDSQLNNYILIAESEKLLDENKIKDSKRLLKRVTEKRYMAIVHYIKGRQYRKQGRYSQAISEYYLALPIFEKSKDVAGIIFAKTNILDIYCTIRNYKLAEAYYLDLISISQKYNYDEGLLFAYSYYGALIATQDLSYSYDILYRGYELSKSFEPSIQINYDVIFLNFLFKYGFYGEFNRVYSESNHIFIHSSCNADKYSSIHALYASWLFQQGKTDSARIYYQLSLALSKVHRNKQVSSSSYLNISNIYLSEKEYDLAKIYLDSARVLLSKEDKDSLHSKYIQYLLHYYLVTNQNDSAIASYQKFVKSNSQFLQEQKNRYSAILEEGYQILSRLEREKHQTAINHEDAKLSFFVMISIMLGGVVVGLFLLFMKKSKNFNLLKLQDYHKSKQLKNYEYELSQLKGLFQNDMAGLFIVDENAMIKYINKNGEGLLSPKNDETILHSSMIHYIGSGYQKEFIQTIQDVLRTGVSKEIEMNIFAEPSRWIAFSFAPLLHDIEVDSVIVFGIDISDRVRALETEKKQKSILQSLFNSVTESILLLDHKGKIMYINQTGAKRIGKTEAELLGLLYIDVLPQSLRHERASQIQKAILKKRPIVYSENIDSFNNLISIFPSFNEEGQLEHISEFSLDITDNILAHEQINSLRQKVLRSQMNPHFIFNSLNAIQSYVMKNNKELAVKYLSSFAKLIRMILDSSRFDYINLTKEINILEYYLQLQQLRFGDKFSWSLEVDNKIDSDATLIPAMLAQPFIENAIEHGLQHLSTKGQVKISFIKSGDLIVFKVYDNGIGRDASRKIQNGNNMHTTHSLSTELFKERLFTLNKYSGRKITYDIIDVKDSEDKPRGTLVIINLPIMYRANIA